MMSIHQIIPIKHWHFLCNTMSIHQIIPIEYPHISYRSMSIHQNIPIESGEYAQLSLPTNEYTPDHSHWRPSTEYTPDHSRVEGDIKMTTYAMSIHQIIPIAYSLMHKITTYMMSIHQIIPIKYAYNHIRKFDQNKHKSSDHCHTNHQAIIAFIIIKHSNIMH